MGLSPKRARANQFEGRKEVTGWRRCADNPSGPLPKRLAGRSYALSFKTFHRVSCGKWMRKWIKDAAVSRGVGGGVDLRQLNRKGIPQSLKRSWEWSRLNRNETLDSLRRAQGNVKSRALLASTSTAMRAPSGEALRS